MTTSYSTKPIELNWPEELDNLMSTSDNAVVYFYKPGCPYCADFNPVYNSLAKEIHRTNLDPGAVPIVMTRMNGHQWKDAINDLRPGFLGDPVNKRGYPTVLFKRGDGTALTWDSEKPRTETNISGLMSVFYGDESLMPNLTDLNTVMYNPDPEFLYFYSDIPSTIPRLVEPLNPSFTSREKAIQSLTYLFATDPELSHRGAAFPINIMDRPDIRIPSIVDLRDGREYALRDSHRWALRELEGTQ